MDAKGRQKKPRVVASRTPEENYFAIVKIAKHIQKYFEPMSRESFEETVKIRCWDELGAGGYNHATVSRACDTVLPHA